MPIIINNTKALSQFILDLAGFSLDKAGFLADVYAFHLHIAFRRQTILQKDKWDELCKRVINNPIFYNSDELAFEDNTSSQSKIFQEITGFVQSIINDVEQAERDSLPVKLFKTGYTSTLHKARNNSEQAIFLLGDPAADITASFIDSNEPEIQNYLKTLKAHRIYLDALLSLPYVVENLLVQFSKNRGCNYTPEKNAEVIASLLSTFNLAVGYDKWFDAIKLALQIAMPDLPFDSDLLELLAEETIPLLDQILEKSNFLDYEKATIFPADKPELVQARKDLLASIGIRFDGLQDILQNTLLDPMQQCIESACAIQGIGAATFALVNNNNKIDSITAISNLFSNIDKIASLHNFDAFMPGWLQETKIYYQNFRTTTAMLNQALQGISEGTYKGLGLFYNYMVYFIPDSVRTYFTTADTLITILDSIDNARAPFDYSSVITYLAFYDLIQAGEIKAPGIKSKLFNAYMIEANKTTAFAYSYKDYKQLEGELTSQKLDKLSYSLSQQIEDFKLNNKTQSAIQQLKMVLMVHHLNKLEAHCDKHIKEILTSLRIDSDVEALILYKEKYLRPAAQRIIKSYMQKIMVPLLEQIIDIAEADPDSHQLLLIYSKLRSDENLSLSEYNILEDYFTRNNPQIENFAEIKEIANILQLESKVVGIKKTPHQALIKQIQNNLATFKTILEHIVKRLDEPDQECRTLIELGGANSNLSTLATSKRNYIQALKKVMNQITQEVDSNSYKVAQELINLINGNKINELKNKTVALSIPNLAYQVLKFAWHVVPDSSPRLDNNFFNNLLTYYLAKTELEAIYKAQKIFTKQLHSHPIPELMPLLNDPLALGTILPQKDEIMDLLVKEAVGYGLRDESIYSWSTNFLKQQGANLISSISEEALTNLFPYPFLGKIAYEALQSDALKSQLDVVMNSLNNTYGNVIGDKALELAEVARERIYPLLGIAIEKSIEEKAYNFAAKSNNQGDSDAGPDAFSLYYLRYRAIKQENPKVDSEECIQFLFKNLLASNKAKSMVIVEAIKKGFAEYDKYIDETNGALDKANESLNFLINNLDFTDPDNGQIIRLAIINRFLLINFEASQNLGERNKAIELQDNAILSLRTILTKVEQGKAKKPELEMEGSFLILKKSPPAPHLLMKALAPSKKEGTKIYLEKTKKEFEKINSTINEEINTREDLLQDNGKQITFLGKNNEKPITQKKYLKEKFKYNEVNRNLKRFFKTVEIISFVFTWISILVPIITLGAPGLLNGLYIALGIAGAVGATATIVGGIALGVLLFARVVAKFISELWAQRHTFNAIENNSEYSSIKKFGLYFLISLQCLGWAIARTFISDFFLKKIINLSGANLSKEDPDLLLRYPTEEAVKYEKESLDNLKQELSEFINLITACINKPKEADLPSFITKYEKLNLQIEKNRAFIKKNLGEKKGYAMDPKYAEKLQHYEAAIKDIEKLYASLKTLVEIESAMQDPDIKKDIGNKLPSAGKKLVQVAVDTQSISPTVKKITVDLEGYLKELSHQASTLNQDNTTLTVVVSGFFKALAYAGQFFNWNRENTDNSVTKLNNAASTMHLSVLTVSNFLDDAGFIENDNSPPIILNNSFIFNQFMESVVMLEESTPAPPQPLNNYSPAFFPSKEEGEKLKAPIAERKVAAGPH